MSLKRYITAQPYITSPAQTLANAVANLNGTSLLSNNVKRTIISTSLDPTDAWLFNACALPTKCNDAYDDIEVCNSSIFPVYLYPNTGHYVNGVGLLDVDTPYMLLPNHNVKLMFEGQGTRPGWRIIHEVKPSCYALTGSGTTFPVNVSMNGIDLLVTKRAGGGSLMTFPLAANSPNLKYKVRLVANVAQTLTLTVAGVTGKCTRTNPADGAVTIANIAGGPIVSANAGVAGDYCELDCGAAYIATAVSCAVAGWA